MSSKADTSTHCEELAQALEALLHLPPSDDTAQTARIRLKIKQRARRALKLWKDSKMLYPIPAPIEFKGDKAFALSLLKQVKLEDHRYICFEVEWIAKPLDAESVTNWIQNQMWGWHSYEGWLSRVHGVPCKETEGRELYPNQPHKLKASRLAWVAQMIAYLENEQ